jgi:hypothetical protein
MAGFMPAIHVFLATLKQDVDGRDKPGHDDRCMWHGLWPQPALLNRTVVHSSPKSGVPDFGI